MRADNYSEDEVRALIENYEELANRRERLWIMVRLLDLEQAIDKLPENEGRAVKLHGLNVLPLRQVGDTIHVSHSTVRRLYFSGVRKLTAIINGRES